MAVSRRTASSTFYTAVLTTSCNQLPLSFSWCLLYKSLPGRPCGRSHKYDLTITLHLCSIACLGRAPQSEHHNRDILRPTHFVSPHGAVRCVSAHRSFSG